MRKAINLIINYFIFLIAGIVLGGFLYSMYINVLNFIIGHEIKLLDSEDFIRSAFYVGLVYCFVICPLMAYYRIRHKGGIPQTVSFIIICLITWTIVFPALVKVKKVYYEHYPMSVKIPKLSGGYFRQNGDKVYYFTRDFFKNLITGDETSTVIIDTSENGGVSVEHVADTPDFELYTAATPYREIELKKTFSENRIKIYINFAEIIERGSEALGKGLTFYLGFLSIAFALCALYAMTNFFNWRLLNAVFLAVAVTGILTLSCVYNEPVFDFIRNKFSRGAFFEFMSNYVDAPLLCVMNIVLGLVFIGAGIIKFIAEHARRSE